MMTGMVQDQNLEKQIERHMGGCMAGFFHIFDRHQSLAAKRLITSKRLPPSTGFDPTTCEEDEKNAGPPGTAEYQSSSTSLRDVRSPAPEPGTPSEAASSARSPRPFPILELKEGTRSPWKFSKEAPRLSLDSRAVTDAKGGLYPREIRGSTAYLPANRPNAGDEQPANGNDHQRRSPSVIARLMGLENLPRANPEPTKNAELRRSASESRVNKDLYRFIEGNHFQQNRLQQQSTVPSNAIRDGVVLGEVKSSTARNARAEQTVKVLQQRGVGLGRPKSFYDSTDFFPEPTKRSASIYEEIERRLRMRGIYEPPKDLETLKQILDALQLKGLLHTRRGVGSHVPHQSNFVYEKGFEDSPVVLMKPSRPVNRFSSRRESESPPLSFRSRPALVRRSIPTAAGDALPVAAASPRRENVRGQSRGRAASTVSPTRSDSSIKSPGGRPMVSVEQKRASPVQSPKSDPYRHRSSQMVTNRTTRIQKPVIEVYPAEDESSTFSESSVSTPSQTDTEIAKVEEHKEGRNLLERCDKLLHSIAEMTADLQPSPVSVLDAAHFYKDESSPSPVMKRSIDFMKDLSGDFDDDTWSVVSFKREEKESSDDADFVYISDILRASSYLPEDSDVFLLLEKQQYLKGKDTSKASRMHRKLIFDTVMEILDRKRQLPPWAMKTSVPLSQEKLSMQQIWLEFRLIRERDVSEEDLLEIICGVLRKDLITRDGGTGWGRCPVEVSESVLDIERQIFKDLIGETIQNLATFASEYTQRVQVPRRRLVF